MSFIIPCQFLSLCFLSSFLLTFNRLIPIAILNSTLFITDIRLGFHSDFQSLITLSFILYRPRLLPFYHFFLFSRCVMDSLSLHSVFDICRSHLFSSAISALTLTYYSLIKLFKRGWALKL